MAASVGDALRSATQWLRASGSRSPRLDAELLLATALGVERTDLFRSPERVLTRLEERRFDGYLVRRQAREPVAYIRGRRAFRGIELEVTREVLIPRPETETLVEVALEALAVVPARGRAAGAPDSHGAGAEAGPGGAAAPGPYEPLVLDVGTGSGCIALALAAENPFVRLVATDVSEAAVEVARRNAARLGLGGRMDFRCGDLLDALLPQELFDLILSNPPYIPEAEYRALEANVRDYEPRVALLGGEDGLDVDRRLIAAAAGRLRPGGVLAVEVGAGQADAVRALFAATGGFAAAQERADLAGISRVVYARLSTHDAGA